MSKLIIRLIVVALSALVVSCSGLNTRSLGETAIGEVEIALGQPRVLRGSRYIQIGAGTDIEQGDVVLTGQDARVRLKMIDGTRISLGHNSEFVFHEFSFKSAQPTALMSFTAGALRIVTGRLTRNEAAEFTVKTPIAVIGVGSADLWGGYSFGEKTLDVSLLSKGGVYVDNRFGRVDISVPGEGTTVTLGFAPGKPVPWLPEITEAAVKSTTL